MANKERFQNPTCGDTINLRLFTYNSNNRRDVQSIEKVEIYAIDKTLMTADNPQGLRLVQTIDEDDITQEETGQYLVELTTTDPLFTIGAYKDVWTVVFEDGECARAEISNNFALFSDLWFTSPIPPIYDFNFNFRPNKVRKGTKRYLIIQVTPNVPRGSDIVQYYENLAIVADLKVSIEMACGDCLPQEQDLRVVVDKELVSYRESGYGYYFLDTTDLSPGIYNVTFYLEFGENSFISERMALQISG